MLSREEQLIGELQQQLELEGLDRDYSDAELKELILRFPVQSIRFKRVFPPRHPITSMTYFGGRPRAPKDFDWPKTGEGKAMLFVGQVALADLLKINGSVSLPSDSVLYFFLGALGDFSGVCVRYVASPLDAWSELTPPEPAMSIRNITFRNAWVQDAQGEHGPIPYRYPTSFLKWQVEPVVANNYLGNHFYCLPVIE